MDNKFTMQWLIFLVCLKRRVWMPEF